jgi:hypothetical protein
MVVDTIENSSANSKWLKFVEICDNVTEKKEKEKE